MKTYQKMSLVLALGLGFSAAANSSPVVLYDNLSGPQVDALAMPASGWVANTFTTGSLCPLGCTVGNITLDMSTNGGLSTGYTLSLYTDGGTVPGAQFGSNFLTPASLTSQRGLNIFQPNQVLTLANNTTYWVELNRALGATTGEWNYTNNVSTGSGINATSDFSYPDFPPMMRVEANSMSAVPVPAAAWLMGSGLIGLVSSWRRKKRPSFLARVNRLI